MSQSGGVIPVDITTLHAPTVGVHVTNEHTYGLGDPTMCQQSLYCPKKYVLVKFIVKSIRIKQLKV